MLQDAVWMQPGRIPRPCERLMTTAPRDIAALSSISSIIAIGSFITLIVSIAAGAGRMAGIALLLWIITTIIAVCVAAARAVPGPNGKR
jgi:hypothetical protein